eukprot:5249244-Amphidinium_carterae.1
MVLRLGICSVKPTAARNAGRARVWHWRRYSRGLLSSPRMHILPDSKRELRLLTNTSKSAAFCALYASCPAVADRSTCTAPGRLIKSGQDFTMGPIGAPQPSKRPSQFRQFVVLVCWISAAALSLSLLKFVLS